MCFFVDLSQLQDFIPTLVKNAHVNSRLLFTKKKSTGKKGGGGGAFNKVDSTSFKNRSILAYFLNCTVRTETIPKEPISKSLLLNELMHEYIHICTQKRIPDSKHCTINKRSVNSTCKSRMSRALWIMSSLVKYSEVSLCFVFIFCLFAITYHVFRSLVVNFFRR